MKFEPPQSHQKQDRLGLKFDNSWRVEWWVGLRRPFKDDVKHGGVGLWIHETVELEMTKCQNGGVGDGDHGIMARLG